MKRYILLTTTAFIAGVLSGAIACYGVIKKVGEKKLKKRVETVKMNPELMKDISELYSLLYEFEEPAKEGVE